MDPETRKFWWQAEAAAIALLFASHLFFVIGFFLQPKTVETYIMFFFFIASTIAISYCFYLHWRFMRRYHLYDFVQRENKKNRTTNGPAPEYWRLVSESGDYILYAWEELCGSGNNQRWRLTDRNGQEVYLDMKIPEHVELWKMLADNLSLGRSSSAPAARH